MKGEKQRGKDSKEEKEDEKRSVRQEVLEKKKRNLPMEKKKNLSTMAGDQTSEG